MRKVLIVAVFAVALFGMLAPPVFAQAPAPKVTITGLFDQITSTGANLYDGNYARTSDNEWYARTRFRPDFAFQVGRTKAVLGLEIDLTYGQANALDGGFPGAASAHKGATNGGLDLNTDVGGMIEVKWIYTEFDLTGKDSLLPFIPVQTVARAGGQPFGTIANYKVAYANGDFAGLDMYTTFAPNLKTHVAYVMVEDEIAGFNRGNPFVAGSKVTRGDDFALIVSPEFMPLKGLDIKPLYSYFHAEGITSGSARRGAANRLTVGGNVNLAAAHGATQYLGGEPSHQENRHTVGVDMRWRSGPFGFDPTVYYQWGTRDNQCLCPNNGAAFTTQRVEADMSAWLVDLIGSFQAGPFLLEVRGIYSTGNEARDNLSKSVRYFEPLDMDTSYYAGWAQIWALGIDYFNGGGGANAGMASNVGYDRYGRAQFGVRGTYNVTPALALYTAISPTWTAESVDTDTTGGGAARGIVAGSDKGFLDGKSSYLGTEWDLGMTWRFAPNTAFDLVGAYLWAGEALNNAECVVGFAGGFAPCTGGTVVRKDADDAWTIASRIRLSF